MAIEPSHVSSVCGRLCVSLAKFEWMRPKVKQVHRLIRRGNVPSDTDVISENGPQEICAVPAPVALDSDS